MRLKIDSEFPEPRMIAHAVTILERGGVIAYPTDTRYGIGCGIFDKQAIDRIYRIRNLDPEHLLSFVVPDLSDIARYALIESDAYRMMKRYLPGPYTFILRAAPEVPKIFQSKRKTVGIRVPNHPVTLALARTYKRPIVSSSTKLGNRTLYGPQEIVEHIGHDLDLILDAGTLDGSDSSVVDLSGPYPIVIREGAGDLSWLTV
ncbi:MAG: threonylcarbamoyl-AMP synthase [Myxococcaceae bacterium]|nr:threonylcarbamoyl-AMP synthase [Myxococcaceae bacterium]MBH2005965.1 threonylcarbamoyl-AMP synthase [Myxococcaceae bacterium]